MQIFTSNTVHCYLDAGRMRAWDVPDATLATRFYKKNRCLSVLPRAHKVLQRLSMKKRKKKMTR